MYFFTGSGKMKDDLRGPYFSRKAGWKWINICVEKYNLRCHCNKTQATSSMCTT
jgi:hypothetical protein